MFYEISSSKAICHLYTDRRVKLTHLSFVNDPSYVTFMKDHSGNDMATYT